jgi:hypothetical protein
MQLNMADLLFEMGEIGKAVELHEKLKKRHPRSSTVRFRNFLLLRYDNNSLLSHDHPPTGSPPTDGRPKHCKVTRPR